MTADELAITALLNRYARAVDTKDWELYRTVFTDDAVIDYSGAGQIVGTRDEVVRTPDGWRSRHLSEEMVWFQNPPQRGEQ